MKKINLLPPPGIELKHWVVGSQPDSIPTTPSQPLNTEIKARYVNIMLTSVAIVRLHVTLSFLLLHSGGSRNIALTTQSSRVRHVDIIV